MSSDFSATEFRRRLVEIGDELRALPSDAFAAKYALHTEADSLRGLLSETVNPDSEAALKRWAGRAGRKGSHVLDYDAEQAKASVICLGEGGASH